MRAIVAIVPIVTGSISVAVPSRARPQERKKGSPILSLTYMKARGGDGAGCSDNSDNRDNRSGGTGR